MKRVEIRESRIKERNKMILKYVLITSMIFATVSSLSYSKFINDENDKIREIISNSREVPLHIKKELGLD